MNRIKISDSDKRLLIIFFAIVILACSYFFIFNKGMTKASELEAQNEQDSAKPLDEAADLQVFVQSHIVSPLKIVNSICRGGYCPAVAMLFTSTPQSRLAPCQLPVRGAFNSLSLFANAHSQLPR